MENQIQRLREEQNLTQMELAQKSGLSLRTIQRVEAGNIPKGYTLKVLAKALEITPEILLTHSEGSIEISRAKLINISSLTFLIFPFGNILVPAILTYNTKDIKAKELGKSIVSTQIIWTVITCVSMIASPFIQTAYAIRIPIFIILLLLLICTNILIIIKNAVSLSQKNELSIYLKNSML